MDPFIGEIRIFSFDFAPEGWAYCNGQTLPMGQVQALTALIGYQFGGTVGMSVGLPNLQSRVPIGVDSRAALTMGKQNGTEQVTLTLAQLPAHTHNMVGEQTTSSTALAGPSSTAVPNLVQVGNKAQKAFSNVTSPNMMFSPATIGSVGAGGPHENRQPFLAINFCICLDGIFPDFP